MTMEARELRIGNVVGTATMRVGIRIPQYKMPFIIHTIGLECECYHLGDNPATQKKLPSLHINDLVGIPLTEEWLLKFGFENDLSQDTPEYRLTNTWINETEYETFEIHSDWEGKQCIYDRTCINFVHQLQNLYFALTASDLELIK